MALSYSSGLTGSREGLSPCALGPSVEMSLLVSGTLTAPMAFL